MLILIADDELGVRTTLLELLKADHEVIACADAVSALPLLEKRSFDLVITDHMMPRMTGMELIKKGKELSPSTSFMLITAYGSVDQAVEAIKLGADDYFLKPFELQEVEHRIKRISDLRSWKADGALRVESSKGVNRLVGKSAAIQSAKDFILKVAPVNSPILILGPSGTGKEVVANAIHEVGARNVRPFVAINCASLNENLTESELFGHEKGAFTGANAAKPGKFELAKGGTIFLDEIGELSPSLQAKLLRVLQEKEFSRVGGIKQIKTDARVIAATHRNLKAMVKEGTFREDLFFRLNVLSFDLPPLCQRPEDIPLLVEYFSRKLSADFGKKLELPAELLEKLYQYSFPGNVRELQNVLERLFVLGPQSGPVTLGLLPAEYAGPTSDSGGDVAFQFYQSGKSLTDFIDHVEAEIIDKAMARSGNNQVKAAEALRITRGTLQYKLKKAIPKNEAA